MLQKQLFGTLKEQSSSIEHCVDSLYKTLISRFIVHVVVRSSNVSIRILKSTVVVLPSIQHVILLHMSLYIRVYK